MKWRQPANDGLSKRNEKNQNYSMAEEYNVVKMKETLLLSMDQ